ncbi:unnamed protein product [Owenia fusiformis]|uniref:Uncharacterized protein n=1 Tax=Owenia fusiformis TaxID=6347 RepID=A0A8J1TT70_OWEFU|nr:unnamed protein product [Owenia fusiformis]
MGNKDKKANQSTSKPKSSILGSFVRKLGGSSSPKDTTQLTSTLSMEAAHGKDNLIASGISESVQVHEDMLDLIEKLPPRSKKAVQYLLESIIYDAPDDKHDTNTAGISLGFPLGTDEQKMINALETEVTSAKEHNAMLQERFNKVTKEKEKYEERVNDLEAEVEGLKQLRDSLQEKIESEVTDKENIQTQLSKKEEIWSDENSENSHNIMLKEQYIVELQRQITDLKDKIKNLESTGDRTRRVSDKLNEDINAKIKELDQKEKEIKALEREKQDISTRLDRVFNDLKKQEELNRSQTAKHQTELNRYNNNEKALSQVQKELSESRNSTCALKEKYSILEKEHAKLSNDLKTLDNKYKAQDETILKLKNENVELRRKTEKMLKSSGGNILDGLVSSVESSIKDEMQTRQIEVHQVPPEQKDVPTVLFCLKSSRLGVDVAKALKQVQGHGTVLLVVVHHQASHVNSPTPSKHILPEATRNQVRDITDIVFWNGAFYSCDFNTSAIETFVNYLTSDCIKEV